MNYTSADHAPFRAGYPHSLIISVTRPAVAESVITCCNIFASNQTEIKIKRKSDGYI